MSKSDSDPPAVKPATAVIRAGRDKSITGPFVNPPVVHASTVLYDSVDDMVHRRQRYTYGRRGTPTIEALSKALSELDGAAGTVLCPSGLSAISTALLACLSSGDHLLMVDSVYAPARHFAGTILKRLGVETTFYDPHVGAGIASLLTDRTRAIYMESPGSLTFEMQDVPAIVEAARACKAIVLMDNTWATPVFYRPHEHGVDVVIHAGTKYLGGHADANIGTISTTAELFPRLKETHAMLGICAAPEDVFLALRGLRTLAVRLDRHMASGLKVARWLKSRPEVLRVLHPALEDDPGHAIWKRDFSGACGLFSFFLKPATQKSVAEFIEGLELFGIGASWGGYESLAVPFDCSKMRSATKWNPGGPAVRLHIGLEDADDLIADLERGLRRLVAE
jgi:cystathionine beta-lyase